MRDVIKGGLLVAAALAAGVFIVSKVWILPEIPSLDTETKQNPKTTQLPLVVGKSTIQVEVRRSQAEQALGLSYRKVMGTDEGMVFVYPTPTRVMYWMKGMEFPLDFLWVRDGKVIQLSTDIPVPTTQDRVPKTVSPIGEVDMVVEVNAGWIAAHGVVTGDVVRFQK